MGHKISAHAMRLGVSKTWNSLWFGKKQDYIDSLHMDLQLRAAVTKKLNAAGLDNVIIRRGENAIEIDVYVARPGVAIGRGGTGMDVLKDELTKFAKKKVNINISEVKKPEVSARIIARTIADGIEKRLPMKPLVEASKVKAMEAGAKGIKIWISGRVGGAAQARTIKTSQGRVPLQTIKQELDYAEERATTKEAGILGVKVWVSKKTDLM
jgi:small subunit ribosomal protein S3